MGWPVLGGSWSGDLGFSSLGTWWAAALLLLVIRRAGMTHQASAEPGEQRQGNRGWTLQLAKEAPGYVPGLLVSQQDGPRPAQKAPLS